MFTPKTDAFRADQVRLAAVFKALSHPARLAILEQLAMRGTCICGELVSELPLAQATVSRHLKTLKEAGLIRGEIDGPRSCYCLDSAAIETFRTEMERIFAPIDAAGTTQDCC